MNTVFIQKVKGEFEPDSLFNAYKGFKYLGYTCLFFEAEDLYNLPLTKETIVVGHISTVRKAFDLLGVKQPPLFGIPEELIKYTYRNVWPATLGEVRDYISKGIPMFSKPLKQHKLFNGQVFSKLKDLVTISSLPNDTEVLCSEPVEFITEYRIFVHKGCVVGCKHYKGDIWEPAHFWKCTDILKNWKNQPIAYSIDIGVVPFEDGDIVKGYPGCELDSVLIEINDAFALGHYGLDNVLYANMIKDRWQEIVNS